MFFLCVQITMRVRNSIWLYKNKNVTLQGEKIQVGGRSIRVLSVSKAKNKDLIEPAINYKR